MFFIAQSFIEHKLNKIAKMSAIVRTQNTPEIVKRISQTFKTYAQRAEKYDGECS